MKLDYGYLAAKAEVVNGLLEVHGGGVHSLAALDYPTPLSVVLVYSVEMEPWEASLPHSVLVRCLGKNRTPIGKVIDLAVNLPLGQTRAFGILSLSDTRLSAAGDYSVEIEVDGVVAKTISLLALQPASSTLVSA